MSTSLQQNLADHAAPTSSDLQVSMNKASKIEPQDPAFICTICQQDQPVESKPKLLGTSPRIVCYSCWCTVLDLSICWGCGECLVRGDEGVSLGWCFWHRNCFGCLLCKTRMNVPENRRIAKAHEGGGQNSNASGDSTNIFNEDGKRRYGGVELEKVPLCGDCTVEMIETPRELILAESLQPSTKYNEGLSPDSLGILGETNEPNQDGPTPSSRSSLIRFRRLGGSCAEEIEQDLRKFINEYSSDSSTPLDETCYI